MHIKTLGNTLMVVGTLMLMAAVLADVVGFGGNPQFGPGQITGLIFGPAIAFVGFNVKNHAD